MESTRINDLPSEKRPREKLAQWGAGALTNAELLALFLRTGVKGESAIEIGHRLLHTHGSLSALGRLDLKQLASEKGLGLAKASQLIAAFELGARCAKETTHLSCIASPQAIYEAMFPLLNHQTQESLHVLLVDSQIRLLRTIELSKGSLTQTICHPRHIFNPVIAHQSYGFVLVHNHPSGNPSPSDADRTMTQRIKAGAELLDLHFIDHVIIGRRDVDHEPYYSFREHGHI